MKYRFVNVLVMVVCLSNRFRAGYDTAKLANLYYTIKNS